MPRQLELMHCLVVIVSDLLRLRQVSHRCMNGEKWMLNVLQKVYMYTVYIAFALALALLMFCTNLLCTLYYYNYYLISSKPLCYK